MFNWSYKFCAKISQDKLIHINMKAFIQHVLLGIWVLLFLYGKKKIFFTSCSELLTWKYVFDGSLTVVKPWDTQYKIDCVLKCLTFLFLTIEENSPFYTEIKSIIWSLPIIANISLLLKAFFNSREIVSSSYKIHDR